MPECSGFGSEVNPSPEHYLSTPKLKILDNIQCFQSKQSILDYFMYKVSHISCENIYPSKEIYNLFCSWRNVTVRPWFKCWSILINDLVATVCIQRHYLLTFVVSRIWWKWMLDNAVVECSLLSMYGV